MTRSVRVALGGAVGFVLLLVAAVSGLVALVGAQQDATGGWVSDGGYEVFTDPVQVSAEVLDVDGDGYGWAGADVAFTVEDGSTEVAAVDLGPDVTPGTLPQVGDRVDVVYERGDPEYVLSAADPVLDPEPPAAEPEAVGAQDRAATEDLVRRSSALAVLSLVGLAVVALLTVVAARRAPAPERRQVWSMQA